MLAWWIGILVGLAAVLVLATRRPRGRGHGAIGQDLFEGILPCALTGSSPRSRPRDNWELRWADVTNLAPGKASEATWSGKESDGARGESRADGNGETAPVAVDSPAGDTVVSSSP